MKDKSFEKSAKALAAVFLKRNIALVYGGGSVGLMGALSVAIANGGGKLTGVIPAALYPKELSGDSSHIKTNIMVDNMHVRKDTMNKLSDAFIAMPGGVGTLEELFEMLTWQCLDVHHKPIGILNINGYYDGLLTFLASAAKVGFISQIDCSRLIVDSDPAKLIDKIQNAVVVKSKYNFDWTRKGISSEELERIVSQDSMSESE